MRVPSPFPPMPFMYDGINPGIAQGANAYAGYVPGSGWPDAAAMAKNHPGKPTLTIATNYLDNADCFDIENGAGLFSQAAPWNARQLRRGLRRPCDYVSLSRAQPLIRTLAAAGQPLSSYWLFTAHYTNSAHLCGPPCGLSVWADATQYSPGTAKRDYDISLVTDAFLAGIGAMGPAPIITPPAPPAPAPTPSFKENPDVKLYVCNKSTFLAYPSGNVLYVGLETDVQSLQTQLGGSQPLSAALLKAMAWNNNTAQNAELVNAGVK